MRVCWQSVCRLEISRTNCSTQHPPPLGLENIHCLRQAGRQAGCRRVWKKKGSRRERARVMCRDDIWQFHFLDGRSQSRYYIHGIVHGDISRHREASARLKADILYRAGGRGRSPCSLSLQATSFASRLSSPNRADVSEVRLSLSLPREYRATRIGDIWISIYLSIYLDIERWRCRREFGFSVIDASAAGPYIGYRISDIRYLSLPPPPLSEQ